MNYTCGICQSKWCEEVIVDDALLTRIHEGSIKLSFIQIGEDSTKPIVLDSMICDSCLESVLEGVRQRSPTVPYKSNNELSNS